MDECDDFLIMSMYKLIANSAENLLLLHPLLRRGGWLVTLLCRVVTWCEELPGGFHDRDHSTCKKPGKSLCFKVLKSKFCFTYRIQFRLVIHLELIGFRLITGLANHHVGVSSEAPCVIHQAKSSLPLSSPVLKTKQLGITNFFKYWKQFTKSMLQHIVALFQMQFWNYEPWNSLFNPNKSILYVSF